LNIIGIYVGHNATVSLIKDNKLVSAISEEKFTNIKNTCGFPLRSFEYTLREFELDPSNVDYVVFSSTHIGGGSLHGVAPDYDSDTKTSPIWDLQYNFFGDSITQGIFPEIGKLMLEKGKIPGQKKLREFVIKTFHFRDSQIMFADHHLCHAYSAIGFYNLHKLEKPVLVITQDGYGDCKCGTVGVYHKGDYELKEITPLGESLAYIYGAVTQYMGMHINEHEYKIMGMAPYPSEKHAMKVYEKKFKDLAEISDGEIWLKHKIFVPWAFAKTILKERLMGERFDNISFALQHLIEERMVQFVKEKIKKYGIKRIAFGGGLFMNVKLNKLIQEIPEIEMCYFMPSSGDESTAIGAVFYALESKDEFGVSDETVYLGKEYTKKDIEAYLSENNIEKTYDIDNPRIIEREVAQLIHSGKIVARFDGRGEWGARSLGNRAILADPSKLESVEVINNAIKCRDFWMPFAPSINEEQFQNYASFNDKVSPFYMITAFDSTAEGKKQIKAALHRKDKTLRPNVVTSNNNFEYHDMITHYEVLSGIGAVLNTSLNIHGYPMVGQINELFFTMDNSDLNYAQLGGYLLKKKVV